MDIKIKEPIQTALDSLEMALEHLQDQEEYTLNDVSLTEIWDIWEEASHVLGMAEDEDLDLLVNGYDIDRDEKIENIWPGLDKIMKQINPSGSSVQNLTYEEFVKKYNESTKE